MTALVDGMTGQYPVLYSKRHKLHLSILTTFLLFYNLEENKTGELLGLTSQLVEDSGHSS